MDNKQSYSFTPSTIDDRLFDIPLYQRLFTWGRKNIYQLIDDLHYHFLNAEAKEYYLGMLTVARQPERLELVDGQQRMTVMLLMSIAFMQMFDSKEWRKFYHEGMRIYFKGRSNDRSILSALVSKQANDDQKNTPLAKGLTHITDRLNKWYGNDIEQLKDFAKKVYLHLTLFVTELPNNYVKNPSSLNEYFEAMNSSGKSLEQHEILKVKLLTNYSGDRIRLTRIWNRVSDFQHPLIQTSNSDNNYVSHQQQVDEYFWFINQCKSADWSHALNRFCANDTESTSPMTIASVGVEKKNFGNINYQDKEDAIISFPEFLLLVLAIHHENEGLARKDKTKLLETFIAYQPTDVELFYRQLLMFRLLLDLYVVRVQYDSSGNGFHTLIFKEWDVDAKLHTNHRLLQYESMLHVSLDDSYIWLYPLLKHLCDNTSPTQLKLLSYLKHLDKTKLHGSLPDVKELTYGQAPRYWFWRLDYAIWEKLIMQGKDSFKYANLDYEAVRQYEFRRNRSIEHLHPQDESENDKWDKSDRDSFGNLAMISPGFNSSQGKLPVHVKFANIEDQIKRNKSLQSLKLYFMYLKARGSQEGWTIDNKNQHADEMMGYLRESMELE